jgi:hypothetical protein
MRAAFLFVVILSHMYINDANAPNAAKINSATAIDSIHHPFPDIKSATYQTLSRIRMMLLIAILSYNIILQQTRTIFYLEYIQLCQ